MHPLRGVGWVGRRREEGVRRERRRGEKKKEKGKRERKEAVGSFLSFVSNYKVILA